MSFCPGSRASTSGWLRRRPWPLSQHSAADVRRVWKRTDWPPASSWEGPECWAPTVGVPLTQRTARGPEDDRSRRRRATRTPPSSQAVCLRDDGTWVKSGAVQGRWATAKNWWRRRVVSMRWNWRRSSPGDATSLGGSGTTPKHRRQTVQHTA